MIRPVLIGFRVALSLGISIGVTVSLSAQREQGRTSAPPSASVLAAQDFLFVAYPDLMTRPLSISIQPSGPVQLITVEDSVDLIATSFRRPAPMLTAILTLSASRQLESYSADGPLVSGDRNRALRAALTAHPEWTDGDAQAWIAAAGARPSPASSLQTELARWRPYLGTAMQPRAAATLKFRGEGPRAQEFRDAPAWTQEVDTTDSQGRATVYRLEFEPFSGRLVKVVKP